MVTTTIFPCQITMTFEEDDYFLERASKSCKMQPEISFRVTVNLVLAHLYTAKCTLSLALEMFHFVINSIYSCLCVLFEIFLQKQRIKESKFAKGSLQCEDLTLGNFIKK